MQARTACINRIRGLLAEFGHVLALKPDTVRRQAAGLLEDLPGWANTVIGDLLSELHRLDERIAQYDRHVAQLARQDARARRLMQLPGIGTTTATAVVAMIGNGHEFKCGRQFVSVRPTHLDSGRAAVKDRVHQTLSGHDGKRQGGETAALRR